MNKIEHWQLEQRQGQPLSIKERLTIARIKAYYEHFNGNVYVSFSGGKDSTVLLDIVRRIYPDVPAVFVDTGLEYPENREFVETIENVIWLKPKMLFTDVIKKYGYPVVSKEVAQELYEIRNTKSEKLKNIRLYGDSKGNGRIPKKWIFLLDAPFKISDRCCHVMKKAPIKAYGKKTGRFAFVGTMASDSLRRKITYLKNGCNSFDGNPMSTPMAFWLEKDIWEYIEKYKLKYSKIYDMGYDRTGCMFCMFGLHLDKNNRFDKMSITHPKIYKYCMNNLGLKDVIKYCKNNGQIVLDTTDFEELDMFDD